MLLQLYRLTFWTRHSKEERIDLSEEEKEAYVNDAYDTTMDVDSPTGLPYLINLIKISMICSMHYLKAFIIILYIVRWI